MNANAENDQFKDLSSLDTELMSQLNYLICKGLCINPDVPPNVCDFHGNQEQFTSASVLQQFVINLKQLVLNDFHFQPAPIEFGVERIIQKVGGNANLIELMIHQPNAAIPSGSGTLHIHGINNFIAPTRASLMYRAAGQWQKANGIESSGNGSVIFKNWGNVAFRIENNLPNATGVDEYYLTLRYIKQIGVGGNMQSFSDDGIYDAVKYPLNVKEVEEYLDNPMNYSVLSRHSIREYIQHLRQKA